MPANLSVVNEAVVIQKLWIEAEIPDFWDLIQILIKKILIFKRCVFLSSK